jgi:hypothetical protein
MRWSTVGAGVAAALVVAGLVACQSAGLQKMAATTAATAFGFSDSFGAAVDDDPSYGLNDSLAARQKIVGGVTYTRTSGVWYSAPAPQPWYSQVNHTGHPGALSFWLGTSAVRMDAPVIAGTNGDVSVQGTVDPVTSDTVSPDWSSLVLSNSAGASGYVAGSNVAIGVLVRSNGGIQVFQGATAVLSRDGFAQPDAQGRFQVRLAYSPGTRAATIDVNDSTVAVTTPQPLPASSTLFMGAYISAPAGSSGPAKEVSALSDLEVSGVNRNGLTLSRSSLKYYGYYAARLTGDSHLSEVAGRSNLNWVNISDVDGYVADVLNGCAPASCVVNTGNEFFSCDSTGMNCHLYSNYADRWAKLAAAVKPYIAKAAAFYMLDEPQYRGATSQEIDTSAKLIKKTFPGTKVMMIEAAPAVTPSWQIPPSVDWVGFDLYCQPMRVVQQRLATLESLLPADSGQKIFLVPEDAPLSECAGVAGHTTDADIAALQWDYFNLAEQNPRVIGLLNFGFWTSPRWTSGHGASDLPLTVNADERVAARILAGT